MFFSSDNPPPLVRILDFFKFILDPCSYESILIIHQNLYPARPVNAEVFDSNHDGQDDPTVNDDGGQGTPLAKSIVPNLIGSGTAVQVRPSTADQLTTATPFGSSPLKKKRPVLASKHKQHAPFDQVTTELFSYHTPHCPLGLAAIKLVFGHLFEPLQRLIQAAKINTFPGADTQPAKILWAPPMRRILAPKYVTVLSCALLLVISF
jgi:hypothetical protein